MRRKWVRKDAAPAAPHRAAAHLAGALHRHARLLAHTLTSRFEQHLPYYRIEQMYQRLGVPIPRQTLCAWSGMAAEAVQLIMEAIRRDSPTGMCRVMRHP